VDLLGGAVSARRPHEARLPQGTNTVLSDDGSQLIALCDGEALLRNLLVEIVPAHYYDGDVPAGSSITYQHMPVFVAGSVLEGARLEADGEVYVDGDAIEAHIRSRQSCVTVMGNVRGSAQKPCILRAAGDVTCGPAHQAQLTAGRDIKVLASACQCMLSAKGNVYLPNTVEHSLKDVELHVEGGIFPTLAPESVDAGIPPDRRHVRVGSHMRASLALHSITSLCFRPCTILDLSTGGAQCALQDEILVPSLGSIVQLKLDLPRCRDHMFVIGRVTRVINPRTIGVSFLQMTQRDHSRLTTFCLQQLLNRPPSMLASRERRGQGRSATRDHM
jgi:hypothetical protein